MIKKSISDLLKEHPFFASLPANYIEFIAGCGRNAVYEAGAYLGREGDPADVFFIIRSGLIGIESYAPDEGPITVQTMTAGNVVGWSWIVPPYRWQFDARALETTRVVALDGKCLRAKCEEEPLMGYQLMKAFAAEITGRFRANRLQLLDLYGRAQK
ncbi:MAG: cyclic nucleotide-binding domain-containing protein [Gammaproteobacteria bacterium]|nr:cyclic nucleotide-binding domain-containing protein [Gammaproteobacteria bacterium]